MIMSLGRSDMVANFRTKYIDGEIEKSDKRKRGWKVQSETLRGAESPTNGGGLRRGMKKPGG